MEDRNLRTAAMLLRQAHNALMRAELLATTEPETKQQIADLKASVAQTAATFGEKLRLKAATPSKLNVSNG